MFFRVDGTFFVQLVNFAIFFALLSVVFLRPVGEAIRKRRAYIDAIHHDYERDTRRARELRAEAEARRSAARRDAEERVVRSRAEANDAAQKTSAEYGDRAARLVADAQRTVGEEVATARSREAELAETLGRSLLERAVGNGAP